jgi:AraC-like DNA-binding protein
VHYFQFARGYVFTGERHDFWEFVYMDKGSAEIGADGESFLLHEGEAAFHKPGEFHTIWAGGEKAPDIIVISFLCGSSAMARFNGARLTVPEEGRRLIAQAVAEAGNAWANKPGSDYLMLERRDAPPVGSEQLVKISLEALLIRLLRAMDADRASASPRMGDAPRAEGARRDMDQLLVEVERYMLEHMGEQITVGFLCRRFGVGRTAMEAAFARQKGMGATAFLSVLRHEGAKRMIRESNLSMTAVAERCGYGSIHYFSRRFTSMEGMTPSEYARSVKSMIARDAGT